MERYLGLDVHAKSCTLAVVGPTGKRLSWEVVETNGEALVEAVMKVRGAVHLCMEEGTQSAWLYEILSPLVAEVVVVGLSQRTQGNKNDTEDAFALAELHRTRTFTVRKRVFKELGRFKRLRSLVKAYQFMTEDLARSKNRLKAVYRSEGVPTAGAGLYQEGAKADWAPKLDEAHHIAAGMLHDAHDALDGLKAETATALLAEASKHAAFKLLQTIPGFGPIRAAQVVSVVVTPTRFRSKRQFWAYCGLAIVTHSSSDWVQDKDKEKGWKRKPVIQTRGLNKNHNHVLKSVFKGAAITVIGRDASCPLRAHYERLLKNGTKPNLACLTIARQLASITLAVWKTKTPYSPRETKEDPVKEKNVDDKALTT